MADIFPEWYHYKAQMQSRWSQYYYGEWSTSGIWEKGGEKNMTIKVGDRVTLKADSCYSSQSKGGEGTVVSINTDSIFPYSVKWDCGNRNAYPEGHLIVIQKGMVTKLKRLARKFLDKDTQALIEAGYLHENLSVNMGNSEHIMLFLVEKYKKELAEEARKLIKERKEEEEK